MNNPATTSVTRVDQRIPDRFIDRAQQLLSSHYGKARIRIDAARQGDNSRIYHATVHTAPPTELAVKFCLVPKTGNADTSAAADQFVALQRVHRAMSRFPAHFRTPTPIFLDAEQAAFAMTWVDGESLTRKISGPAAYINGQRYFERVGAWMGHFHTVGFRETRNVNLEERIAVIDAQRVDSGADRIFSRATLLLEESTDVLKGSKATIAWLHGDCKTDNFIIDGETVYGIDISLIHENPVEYDLAQFLNNLALLTMSPRRLYLGGMRHKFEEAFWQGYLCAGPSVSGAYLVWLRLGFSLSFWHTMTHDLKPGLRKWALNRMFAALVHRLSKELQAIKER